VLSARPWLNHTLVIPPAALDAPPAGLPRRRPLIYVYNLPAEFTTRLLQYRNIK
jgi:hypothetical protein